MLPKVGVFGVSTLTVALIKELHRLSFEIIGLWDQNLKNARAWCDHFKIAIPTDSIEELLKNQEVDLVIISTSPNFHKEIATKALAAGKHVICEPPFGMTTVENALIMEQAVYYPSLMMLSTFGLRYLSGFQRAKDLLGDGCIGNIQSFEVNVHCGPEEPMDCLQYDWRCIRQLCAGPLFSVVVHVVDVLTYLSSKRAYTVCGTVKRFQEKPWHFKYDQHLTREDFVSFQMLLEGNLPCTCIINNNFTGRFDFKTVVTGSKGAISISNCDISVSKAEHSEHHYIYLPLSTKDELSPSLEMGKRFDYRHPEPIISGILKMCNQMKSAFENLPERRCWNEKFIEQAGTLTDGQYARAVAEAIKRSSDSRRWTEVRIPVKKKDERDAVTVTFTSPSRMSVKNSQRFPERR